MSALMFSPVKGASAQYPIQAPLETKANPTGIDLYSRFALAGALGVSIRCERAM